MWPLLRRTDFRQLVADYLQSPAFLALSPTSQVPYRRVVMHLASAFGSKSVRSIGRADIDVWLVTRSHGAANDDLKKLRILFRFALERGMRRDDPTLGIRRFAPGPGHHTWTEDEIAGFEARWPLATRERLAFALLLFTGQRRGDVVRMHWCDIADGCIRVVQSKTGTQLLIPLHPRLQAALPPNSAPETAILCTSLGKAFTSAGFGRWMADRIAAAGLPDRCVTHGLRKAAARRLAEAGCTAHEIGAITGHRTLHEIERYTRAAEQRRLARAAMGRVAPAESGG